MPSLTLQLPGLPPVTHLLKEETVTIGRMRGNAIVIDDSSVSLLHAKITRANGQYFLKDLNSTNGTLLNGQSIDEAQLRENDRVAFADVKGHFSLEPAIIPEPAVKTSVTSVTSAPAPAPPVSAFAPASAFAGRSPAVAPFAALPPAPAVPLPGSNVSVAKRKRKRPTPPLVIFAGSVAGLLIFCFAGIKGYQAWQEKTLKETSAQPRVANPTRPPSTASSVTPSGDRPSNDNAALDASLPPSSESDSRVPQLAANLKSSDVNERRRAAKTLHSLGEEAKTAEPELRAALSDADEEVQIWSALALVNNRVYEKKTVPICVRALHHENSVLRQVVCLSLALFPYEESEKALVIPALQSTATKDGDDDVKRAAVSALSIIAPSAAPTGTKK
jgi:predicted component of type VI protein secretion system